MARHLYRRVGYGASPDTIEAALLLDPGALVDQLVDEAIQRPLSPAPAWAQWTIYDYDGPNGRDFELLYEHYFEWAKEILVEMASAGLREKLVLFWSNHFVTSFQGYQSAPALLRYHRLLQTHALGNFKAFVHAIGIDPSMLIYLNGEFSTKYSPNENYARELYELFTLGNDNGYTQEDIVETSRALTGWQCPDTVESKLDPALFDQGSKTIFGQTGNWGYDDVIELLFTHRAERIATFICQKLYRFFVYEEVNDDIVAELAQMLIQGNWELAPVLRTLLKSEHLLDTAVISTQIKSPLQIIFQQVNELDFPFQDYSSDFLWGATNLGQQIYSPPDVAGWPGHRKWISTSRLSDRWRTMEYLHYLAAEHHAPALKTWIKTISPSHSDPEIITQSVIEAIFPAGLEDPLAYDRASIVFRGDVPSNYFEDGSWNLDWPHSIWQIFHLLSHLSRLPEFQLS